MYTKSAQQQATPPARVDLVLEIYDGVLDRLARAKALLPTNPDQAATLLNECQLAVSGIALGIDGDADEVNANFVLLYEFVGHCIQEGDPDKLQDAQDVLQMLREGFQSVRDKAVEMERNGELPPLNRANVQATA